MKQSKNTIRVESKEERYQNELNLRAGQLRELRDMLYAFLVRVCGSAFKLTRIQLPEMLIKQEREDAALGFTLKDRANRNPQLSISERATLEDAARMILTALLSQNVGLQEMKNRANQVVRLAYANRGFKELITSSKLSGKCSRVEFGEHAAEIKEAIAALTKVRGSYTTSADEPREKKDSDSGSARVAVEINGAKWNTALVNVFALRDALAKGELPTLTIPDAVIAAWDARQAEIKEKAKQRRELVANRKANGAKRSRRERKAEIAAAAIAAANGGTLPITTVGATLNSAPSTSN